MRTQSGVLANLVSLVEKNTKYKVEGKINKNLLAEDARKYNPNLLNLLQSESSLKSHFFAETDGGLIFKKDVFLQFINNKEFLPDSYTKYKIKIGLGTDDGSLLSENAEVVLNWPYKDAVLEGGQDKEDQKRKEIFFNETLAPDQITRLLDNKVYRDWKRIDKDGERELDKLNDHDNLIIKGNNLVVLHNLRKRYANKVKLIYIDPPYNTGSDSFGYNDNFNHSTWLTFMKNRLEVARKLLREDGAIFISLDDSESHYAKVLCDEVFGRENFLANIAYQRSGAAGLGQGGKFVVNTAEAIIVYAKNKRLFTSFDLEGGVPLELKHMKRYNSVLANEGSRELIAEFPARSNGELVKIYKHKNYSITTIPLAGFEKNKAEINDKYVKNFEKIFRLNLPQAENSFQHDLLSRMDDDGLFSVDYIASRGRHKNLSITNHYYKKQLIAWLKSSALLDGNEIQKTNKLTDFWAHGDIPKADLANEGRVKLSRGKKPEQLIKRIINMVTQPKDIILDYHLGSGTTAAVAHKMDRQYIGVEQLFYGDNDPTVRLKNVINGDPSGISKSVDWQGGGSFVYAEIMNNSNDFRERVTKAKSDSEYISLFNEASSSSFLSYRIDPSKMKEIEFQKLSSSEKRQLLLEIIDNNTLYVNYDDINDPIYNVKEADKRHNTELYKKIEN